MRKAFDYLLAHVPDIAVLILSIAVLLTTIALCQGELPGQPNTAGHRSHAAGWHASDNRTSPMECSYGILQR